MTALIPPHVTPPKSVKTNLALLRQTSKCIIATWPEAMYHAPSYAAPVKGITYVMEPNAICEVLLNKAGNFEQSKLTRRILRPVWRSGLTVATGERWRAQRRAASPVFTPASVEAIIPAATRAGAALCESWRSGAEMREVTSGLGDAAQQIVMDSLLGQLLPPEAKAEQQRLGARLIGEMNRINYADLLLLPNWTRRFLGPTFYGTAKALHAHIARYLRSAGDAHTSNAPILERLIASVDPETGKPMSAAQLRDNIVGFVAAGRETTALSIGWAMMLLALDPAAQDRVHTEVSALDEITPHGIARLDFTRAVLFEAMRLYPPAPQIARDCLADTELAGRTLRRGDVINLPIYIIHRHHALWDQPDAFVPERFMNLSLRDVRWQYLPFGGGGHVCLGQAFAITEATVLLAQIIRSFRISTPKDWLMEFETGASLRPKRGLHLTLTPR